MRDVDDVRATVARRLDADWAQDVIGSQRWPWRAPIGDPARAGIDVASYTAQVRRLNDAARQWGCSLETTSAKISGFTATRPTRLVVPDLDTAARIAGAEWPGIVDDGRRHLGILGAGTDAVTLRAVRGWTDTNVALLRDTADWFRENGPAHGLTPRQVPVPGLHAKWLDSHHGLVARLAGLGERGGLDLGRRPATVELTYLDPGWRDGGGRRHDLLVTGDRWDAPYPVHTVLICENKDSRIFFPPTPATVALEGGGTAVSRLAGLPWLADVPRVVYWGDIDTSGYEILDLARSTLHRDVPSILMDATTRVAYERFGTRVQATSTRGEERPIARSARKALHLTAAEDEVYSLLTDPGYDGNLRYEQERIPLPVAAATLASVP